MVDGGRTMESSFLLWYLLRFESENYVKRECSVTEKMKTGAGEGAQNTRAEQRSISFHGLLSGLASRSMVSLDICVSRV